MKSLLLRHARTLFPAFFLCVFFAAARADTIDDRKAAILGDHVTSPFPNPNHSDAATRFLGRAAYALAAYQTNTGLVQADAYIESLHDDAELVISHDSNLTVPTEIPCFFAMPLLTRIYLDPILMSRMGPTAAEKLRTLMYWFIDHRSTLTAAAPANLWTVTYTENHNAVRKTTYMLIAQAMMNDSAYGPDFALADGGTVREHHLAWNTYWKEFLRQSAQKGIQLEIASPQYEKYTVACWYNVRDLAADPATRAQADKFLTLYWTDVAHEFMPGAVTRGGAGLRMYQNTYLTQGATYSFRPWLYMYDWHDAADTAASSHPMILCAAASTYAPPAVVRAIGANESGLKTPHLYSSIRMGRQGGNTNEMAFPADVRRDSWWTPDYVMGSMTYDSAQTYARIGSQCRFFSIAFNSAANDRLVIKAWGTYSGNLAEFWGITGACHRNVLLAARDLDSAEEGSTFTSTRLFLGGDLAANQTTDASGWIFTRAGDGYAGIWVGTGGYTWDTTTTSDGKYLDLTDSWSPMLVQCGRAADYASFDAFKAALIANPPAYNTGSGVLSHTSPEGDTFEIARQSAELPKINGAARPQNPVESYASPHLNALADADEMTVSYPGHTDLVLDFSYPESSRLAAYAPGAPATGETTYVTSSQTLRGADGNAWTSGDRAYSATVPLSPAAGYTGPVFHGGFAAGATANGAFDTAQVRNATSDAPRIQYTTSAAGAGSYSFLFALPLSKSATLSSVKVSGQVNRGSGAGNSGSVYLAVRIGSNWYVNNTPVPLNATQKPYAFESLDAAAWAAYNPGASLHFPGAGALDLAGAGAVGEVALLIEMTWSDASASGSAKIIDLISFVVEGEPAPDAAPVITSDTAATATVGTGFTYTITAGNSPASFAAAGMPAGLILNPVSGVIAGVPAESGEFNITLTAVNGAGTSAPVTLALTVAPDTTPSVLAAYAPDAPATGETSYVTAHQTLRNTDGSAWSSGDRAYSATAPLSPASTNYFGPVFLGGFEAGSASAGAFDTALVRNAASDAPRIQYTTSAAGAGNFSFLFAMPLSTPSALSTLAVSGQVNRGSGSGNGGALYVAVKIGSDWYVNNTPVPLNSTQKPYAFENLNLGTWAAYNPTTSLHFPGDGTLNLNAASSVTDVALLTAMTWSGQSTSGAAKVIDLVSFKVTRNPAPAVAPEITSATTGSATVGTAFTYTITAVNSPTSFTAAGLPAGLSLNSSTGLISGTPTESGDFNVTLIASNGVGAGAPVTLALAVAPEIPPVPEITSATTASATVGSAFSYTITASNSPTGFTAAGLPAGLSLDATTGEISGTPAESGAFNVTLTASNANGSGAPATLVLTVISADAAVPVITSGTEAAATVGAAFSYTIAADHSPTGFTATGLPAGLSLNAATGAITGAPTMSGTFHIELTAINANGPGDAVTLVLTVSPLADYVTLAAYAPDAPGTPETNYVTSSRNLRTVDGTVWSSGARAYSETVPLSPLSNYNGPEFFGGFDIGPSSAGTFDIANVRDAASDAPRVQFTTATAGAGSFSFLFALELSTPASLSSLTVSGQANRSSGTGNGGSLYVAVKIGSNWYVNNTPVLFNATQKPYAFEKLNLGTWALYTPGTNPNFPGDGTIILDAATSAVERVALLSTMTWSDVSAWGSQKVIDLVSLKITGEEAMVVPAITSSLAATAAVGSAFTYTATASNTPLSFAASGLPAGLAIDPGAGVISGTPGEPGVFNVALNAANANGAGPSATLVLTVHPPATAAPVITSATAASTTVGAAFTYAITAENVPTRFTASGLPGGFVLDEETGVISGSSAVTGSFAVTLGASNGYGDSDPVVLVISVIASESEIDTIVTPGGLGSPTATVVDGDGNSYVADIASGEIRKVASDGTVSTFAAIPQLAALAIDSAGNFYTAGNDGAIRKVLADGTVVSPALATGITTPGGIAVGADGTVYASKTAANTIVKITAGGVVSALAGSGAAGSVDSATGTTATLNGPTGLALNTATDLLYVADTINCLIREINLSTTAVTTVAGQAGVAGDAGSEGSEGKATDGALNTPEAIAIDANGLLYIADTGNNLVRGFDPVSGALVTLAGDTGATTLDAPAGLAFDPDGGLLYVADTGNDALRTVTIAPLFAVKFSDRTIPTGTSVTLDGTAWASPAAAYLWTLNGTTSIGTAATFTIDSGAIGDTGVYAVTAGNIAGSGTLSARLTFYENYQREGTLYRSDYGGAGAPGLWLLGGMILLLFIRNPASRRDTR